MKVRKLAPNIPMYQPQPATDHPTQELDEGQPEVTGSTADAGQNALIGRHLMVLDISLIDANPLAPREVYTPQMIRDRAEALRDQGQHDPIHVIPNPDAPGRYIICDGWTRVQACRDHQVMDALLAEVHHNLTLEQAAWFGYEQNEEREQQCDLDRAMFYEKILATGTTSAIEVAKRAGISKSQMSFYRSFAKLADDVLDIVRSNPTKFGASAAYQLLKVQEKAGVRQSVRLAVAFSEENRSYAWLTNQTQSLIAPKKEKPKLSSRHIRFANGYYRQKGDCFELNINVDPAKRAAFAAELEALVQSVAVDTTLTPNQDDNPENNGES